MALPAHIAHAQDRYPSRALQLIVPTSAGSQMDVLARALAEGLSRQAGHPVVVLNRDGAALALGMDAVAKAKPDGYTIGFGPDAPLSLAAQQQTNLPFKLDDFEMVCRTNASSLVLVVGPQSPYKNLQELLAAARQAPGKLSYGTLGPGTSMHLLVEGLALEHGVKFNHVPFKSPGDMGVQTLNGSLDFAATVPNTLAVGAARGMRGLLSTGDAPIAGLPAMPVTRDVVGKSSPLAAFGSGNVGLYAPKNLPIQALDWLRSACKTAAQGSGFAEVSARTFTPQRYADSADFLDAVRQNSRLSSELARKLPPPSQQ